MKNLSPFLLAILIFVTACEADKDKSAPPEDKKNISLQNDFAKYDSFGFRIDTAVVEDYRIKRNESLYFILQQNGFSPAEIFSIVREAEGIINDYDLKPGQFYRTYRAPETEKEGAGIYRLVLQPAVQEYIVFDFTDSLEIFKSEKEISFQDRSVAATIQNSLYETMNKKDISPMLAYRLSEIFAWQIDFFSLRNGDTFKMIYEEKYVDDSYYNIGEIKAVEFIHRGESYFAYRFEAGEDTGYYDEKGNSVQKALLKAPFKYGQRISSGFSHSRFHPVLKRRTPHYGVDYAAPHGTPVLSVGDGTVTEARYSGASGNMVKVRHNKTYQTAYLHLNDFAKRIRKGARVNQGQIIGYVGKTGRVTGTHLDYRIYKNGRPVNPLTVDLPASESVPDSLKDAFMRVRKQYDEKLNTIPDPVKTLLSDKFAQ